MYKIIITSLCVLLGFAACRSGKGVTQGQKGGKDSVGKVTISANDTVRKTVSSKTFSAKEQARIDSEARAFLNDPTLQVVHPTLEERELVKKRIEELKNNGHVYSSDPKEMTETILVKDVPPFINELFPGILFCYQRNIMGQGSIVEPSAIYNDQIIIPTHFNTLLKYNNTLSIETQLKAIITMCHYPFPVCNIESISTDSTSFGETKCNYKAIGTYNSISTVFYLQVADHKIHFLVMDNADYKQFMFYIYED